MTRAFFFIAALCFAYPCHAAQIGEPTTVPVVVTVSEAMNLALLDARILMSDTNSDCRIVKTEKEIVVVC